MNKVFFCRKAGTRLSSEKCRVLLTGLLKEYLLKYIENMFTLYLSVKLCRLLYKNKNSVFT